MRVARRLSWSAHRLALVVAGLLVVCGSGGASLGAQVPPPVDTRAIGPKVGATIPPFSGTDQFGKAQTLASIARARGAMVVFFRSADW